MEDDEFPVEAHVYGVNPVTVVGNVRNAVDDYCNDAIDSLEAALLQSLSKTKAGDELERARVTVTQCAERLRKLLAHCFDKNLDKLELYWLRNTLRIPEQLYPHLGLPPHLASLVGVSAPVEEDEARMDAELERLHERLQAARHLFTELQREALFYQRHLQPAAEEARAVRAAQALLHQPLTAGRDVEASVEHSVAQSVELRSQTKSLHETTQQLQSLVAARERRQQRRDARQAATSAAGPGAAAAAATDANAPAHEAAGEASAGPPAQRWQGGKHGHLRSEDVAAFNSLFSR